MSAAKDRPVSKPATEKFREGFDRIFGKKPEEAKTKGWIERHVEVIESFLAEDEAALANNPDDIGLQIIVKNKQQQLDTLKQQ